MALTTRTHRVAVTAALQLRTRVHRVSVAAVESFKTTRVHRLSVAAAPPPTVTLTGPTTIEAGGTVTLTATITGATSVTWTQTQGWTVTRTDSPTSTSFKAPIRLSGLPVTIQAVAANANGTSDPTTITVQVAAAPVAYWNGTTLQPTVIDLHT